MVEASGRDFIIRKSTFIVKNQGKIEDVYDFGAKVN